MIIILYKKLRKEKREMVSLNDVYWKARNGFYKFIHDEKGDVNIVSIVVLIGVAVLLALIFKDAITELIESMLDTITENATDAVGGGEN